MKNILVLDDNKDFLDAMSTRLRSCLQGCNILTASDGAHGKEILRSMHIDLVLTDLTMPLVDGYMLIEHAKKLYPSVPICAMTADCTSQVKDRLRSMGVRNWIEKPFKTEQLAHLIAQELKLESRTLHSEK